MVGVRAQDPERAARQVRRHAAVSAALGHEDPAQALLALAASADLPRSLAEFGVRSTDLAAVTDEVMSAPYSNPRPGTKEAVEQILWAAWTGELL